ncbi:MAG: hypothetical protein Lokiarch_39850 [Candidatus Lokiarchaeum sp. GC14_75]|nr:MAG: hypothetical protein Lokiarch_39850 [Candidatus Lokiarchaeum sp. GC14_75]
MILLPDLENFVPHVPHFIIFEFQRRKDLYAELASPILVYPASAESLDNISNTVVKYVTSIRFFMEHARILIIALWAFSSLIFCHN